MEQEIFQQIWNKQGELFELQRRLILLFTDILKAEGITIYNDTCNTILIKINNTLAEIEQLEIKQKEIDNEK